MDVNKDCRDEIQCILENNVGPTGRQCIFSGVVCVNLKFVCFAGTPLSKSRKAHYCKKFKTLAVCAMEQGGPNGYDYLFPINIHI